VSIATAYFTRMSQHASSGDLTGVRRDLSASIRVISLIMVLATIVLIAVAYTFSGFFTTTFPNQLAMGNVVIGFLVGLPPFSILFVVFRGFFALGDTRTPFYVTVFQAVVFSLGAVIVLFFVPKEFIGFAVALVMSIAGTLQATLAVILIRRRLGGGGGRVVVRSLVRYVIAAIPTLAIGILIAALVGVTDPDGFASASVPGSVISMIVIGVVMSLIYLGALRLLKSPELSDALTPLLARVRRRSS
jgi:putative peptidoglycan lipid II flippase